MSPSAKPSEVLHPTPTVEDYLMAMYVMERDHGEIIAARLAELLSVTSATVAMTLKRMERDHWISGTARKKGIHLTEYGRAAAQGVVRRHMLTEWLLLKILKVPFLQIHVEAHNLEHDISALLEERLVDILGAPKVCPHGNPFPGYETEANRWVRLTEIPVGGHVIIRRLHEFAENNLDLLHFLVDNGIMPGIEVTISEVMPFNQTLTLKNGDQKIVLGYSVAHSLFGEIS